MKVSTKEDKTYRSLPIAFMILFIAVMYGLLIASDIPVKFTATESLIAQGLVFAFTIAFVLGSLRNANEQVRFILIGVSSVWFGITLSKFGMDSRSVYFTAEFIQLLLPYVLQPF